MVDADVFIRAYRDDYPPEVFPGVWDTLARACDEEIFVTTPRVFKEVGSPPGLAKWMQDRREKLVINVAKPSVVEALRAVLAWVDDQDRFTDRKRREFERCADPELISCALANRFTVLTNEQPAPYSSTVKIPDVCDALGVEVAILLDLFRDLGTTFQRQSTPGAFEDREDSFT